MSIEAQFWTFVVLLLLIGVPPGVWNVVVTARQVLRWLGLRIARRWWEP